MCFYLFLYLLLFIEIPRWLFSEGFLYKRPGSIGSKEKSHQRDVNSRSVTKIAENNKALLFEGCQLVQCLWAD